MHADPSTGASHEANSTRVRPRRRSLTLTCLILFGGLAIVAVSFADLRTLLELRSQSQAERDEYALHALHLTVQEAVLNEAVVATRVGLGLLDEAAFEAAHEERLLIISQLEPVLETLIEADGTNGRLAVQLQRTINRLPLGPELPTSESIEDSLVSLMVELRAQFVDQAARGRSAGNLVDLATSPLVNGTTVGRMAMVAEGETAAPTLLVTLLEAGSWSNDPGEAFNLPGINRQAIDQGFPNITQPLLDVEAWESTRALHEVDLWLQQASAHARDGLDLPAPPALVAGDLGQFYELSEGLADALRSLSAEVFDRQVAAGDSTLDRVRFRIYLNLAVTAAALIVSLIALARLIHGMRAQRDELQHLADTDALTGLGNRFVLQQMAKEQLATDADHGLIHVDLDRFKQINDTFGHQAGDAVLVEVAARLRQAVDNHGRAFRTGGDEFVVLCEAPSDVIGDLAELLRLALADRPVMFDGHALPVTASIGAVSVSGPAAYEDLMTDADLATYRAKVGTRNQAVVVEENSTLSLVRRLDEAVASGEIVAWFQPEISIETGRAANFECLARWVAPSGEVIPSADWIWTVEWMGATDLVLEAVVRSIGQAHAKHPNFTGRYFINIDARLLCSVSGVNDLLDLVDSVGVPTTRLGIDLIGDIGAQPLDRLSAAVRELRDAGINIALDDFGAISAPLAILTELPIDIIKIDRSLVVDAPIDPRKQALLRTAVAAARALAADVLAEGIETQAELDVVTEIGVDFVTGSLTGGPAPVPAMGRAITSGPGQRRVLDSRPAPRHAIGRVAQAAWGEPNPNERFG